MKKTIYFTLVFLLVCKSSIAQQTTPFEIWNWQDLAKLDSILRDPHTQWASYGNAARLMQNLGRPDDPNSFGNSYSNSNCPYNGTDKAYGWYGYQGYIGNGVFNKNDTTLTGCGWEGSYGWKPIGEIYNFKGEFDGNGKSINGLWINRNNIRIALFSFINNAYIHNLNINIDTNYGVTGNYYTAGLASLAKNSTIKNISVCGGNVKGNTATGGMIAKIEDSVFIKECHAEVNVISANMTAGGLVGLISNDGMRELLVIIEDCYATGNVSSIGGSGGFSGVIESRLSKVDILRCYSTGLIEGSIGNGGFIGAVQLSDKDSINIVDCYTVGGVKQTLNQSIIDGLIQMLAYYSDTSFIIDYILGGAIGFCGTITLADQVSAVKFTNCYSAGGLILNLEPFKDILPLDSVHKKGFIGGINNEARVSFTNCYFDKWAAGTDSGGVANNAGITPLSTSEMIQQSKTAGFGYGTSNSSPWQIDNGITYPYLYYQKTNPVTYKEYNLQEVHFNGVQLYNNQSLYKYAKDVNSINVKGTAADAHQARLALGDDILTQNGANAPTMFNTHIVIQGISGDNVVKPYAVNIMELDEDSNITDVAICVGESLTFNSAITDGGTSPTYQWQVNGVDVQNANDSTFTYTPANGDTVICFITSNAECANPKTTVSQKIIVRVDTIPVLTDDIIIDNSVCINKSINVSYPSVVGGVWSINNDNVTIDNPNANSTTITGNKAGKTYVTYTVTNGQCETNKTALVKVMPETTPTIIIGVRR